MTPRDTPSPLGTLDLDQDRRQHPCSGPDRNRHGAMEPCPQRSSTTVPITRRSIAPGRRLEVARLAEKTVTNPEHHGVDHQPQLVDEVVFDQVPDQGSPYGRVAPRMECAVRQTSAATASPRQVWERIRRNPKQPETRTRMGPLVPSFSRICSRNVPEQAG